jgi:hypothetical protein
MISMAGASVGGKTNVYKAERKGGLGARKPLSDLSNSEKPVLNRAPKKQTSKNVTFIDEHSGASKIRDVTNKKTSISKASAKLQTGSRKALSDISNSGKADLHAEALNKNLNLKLGVVAEKPLHHVSAIAEERFLHNHQECIKAQTKSMDMDEFLKTVGLDNGNIKFTHIYTSIYYYVVLYRHLIILCFRSFEIPSNSMCTISVKKIEGQFALSPFEKIFLVFFVCF